MTPDPTRRPVPARSAGADTERVHDRDDDGSWTPEAGEEPGFQTAHAIHASDARSMDAVPAESVDLVVTSPPYPMIEMWDELFADLVPASAEALAGGDGETAFEAMHSMLDDVWAECWRVLDEGGIAAINVGDATRTVDGRFRVYPNHARVLETCTNLGFEPLPDILWHKPANSAAKFMGSGMLPPNAYVTLEHEYVLLLRKGDRRAFEPKSTRRYESAFFWEERNRWFTDIWTEVRGDRQAMADPELRERSGAFPFELPYRLVNMFSVYGDTVLDPFWGTGTTSLAAMVAGRNSVGYELEEEFRNVFRESLSEVPDLSREVLAERLSKHEGFVHEQAAAGDELSYEAAHYDTRVRTKQERDIRFYEIEEVLKASGSGTEAEGRATYSLHHVPATDIPTGSGSDTPQDGE